MIVSLYPIFATSQAAILGAMGGYGILWISNELFRLFRGKDGIFPGDFKLCAAIGASVGLKSYLIILGLSMFLLIVGSAIEHFYINRSPTQIISQKRCRSGVMSLPLPLSSFIY